MVDDPITLLQNIITQQKKNGHSVSGTVLNIATQAQITFFTNPNSKPGDETKSFNVPKGDFSLAYFSSPLEL